MEQEEDRATKKEKKNSRQKTEGAGDYIWSNTSTQNNQDTDICKCQSDRR